MLISSKDVQRLDIPHEPGQWVELRPLTARHYASIQRESKDESTAEITLRLLSSCLVAWSYDGDVNTENIDNLDYETFEWLDRQMSVISGRRSDPESNGSVPQSSPTTDPAQGDSPKSLATSERSPGSESST